MPPKKSALAATKKASKPKVTARPKTRAVKVEKPTTTNGVNTTTKKGKRKAEELAEASETDDVDSEPTSPDPPAKRSKTSAPSKVAPKKPAAKKAAAKKPAATKAAVRKPATNKPAAAKPAATKPAAKKPAVTKPATKKPAAAKPAKVKVVINFAPVDPLNVYVFGEGSNGELGLGSGKGCLEVKRPRLNPLLAADSIGVVQVAVGGMHTIVLTNNNKILTWGINDQFALGRDTAWDGGLKDMDADDSDSEAEEITVNPHESSPAEIDLAEVPEGTVWTQVAASDSATFALTSDGFVYGWGTFRGNDGIIGFSATTLIQRRPTLLKDLKKITQVACGSNHVLALTATGGVYAWGCGQQNQLGRRIIERMKHNGLKPQQFGLKGKKITTLGCGSYHSFAVTADGKVYAWGLNSFGETGISKEIGDGEGSDVHHPALVAELSSGEHGKVTHIEGGAHHSICITDTGKVLVWGRLDGYQLGIALAKLPQDKLIYDSAQKPRILTVPMQVPGLDASYCAAGSDHCVAVAKDGKVYSWGFNATYQCGLGNDEDVEECTQIDNTAVRDKKIVWAGAGGQFSVIAGLANAGAGADASAQPAMVNGTH